MRLLAHKNCTAELQAINVFFEDQGYIHAATNELMQKQTSYVRILNPKKKDSQPAEKTGPMTEHQKTQMRMAALIKAAREDTFSEAARASHTGGSSAGAASR